MPESKAHAWEEIVTIPTYPVGEPNKNPMFLEKRVYQGSSGVVYPHPIIETISDEKEEKQYKAVFLENQYIKVMLLPELGGRVQMALDKTNSYHFIHYNRVIKPALVGLTGPWISGGIEFNWPQHHRPSTFEPVEYVLQANNDGSHTVWMGEIERMFRTKGMAGFTIYPDRAYLELNVQLYNRTSEPQTFLWWANPAVHVNDDYQSVFPPDVHAVMDHGKRDVSSFPIATGTYYKVDYSPGTDISRYKNIPVPTSYMAYHSDFDFLGCYDHGQQAGMMHVANHHLVPGKKQWTWGNGEFGQRWDRHLTDEDGPYIELMCGAFTDNQPDFSWLMPGEEKRFTQIFMPYKQIGAAKNASKDVVINLEKKGLEVTFGVYVTSPQTVTISLEENISPQLTVMPGKSLFSETLSLTPESAFVQTISLEDDIPEQRLTLRVLDGRKTLIAFTPLQEDRPETPPPATAAKPPSEIASNDELFLNGLHLEQYRHATYAAEAYYLEALRRDPLDSRCNNAMGLLMYRRGRFEMAEDYFRTAIKSLTRRNPNPYDGEPYYNLGLALKMQGRYQDAYDAFYKSVWNAAWQSAGYFELARLSCTLGNLTEAVALARESLAVNRRHHKARHLLAVLLRHLGEEGEAQAIISMGLADDPLNYGLLIEKMRYDDDRQGIEMLQSNPEATIEIALDYVHAGPTFWYAAALLLSAEPGSDATMAGYYLGWLHHLRGEREQAKQHYSEAAQLPPDYCFPNRVECVPALQAAIEHNPADARAPYYLGNFWYANKQYDLAIEMWEKSVDLDSNFPTAQRNLGLAYMNKRQDAATAQQYYEQAFELDTTDSRILFELDQLYKKTQISISKRLGLLQMYESLVAERDDLTIEFIALLNLTGQHDEALKILQNRTFHPWEGGEGKVIFQYTLTIIQLAQQYIADSLPEPAIELLEGTLTYPENLGEGKLINAYQNDVHYYLGQAYAAMGNDDQAKASYQLATRGDAEPTSAMYYNDQPPELVYYQGLAYRALGDESQANTIFRKLVEYGEQHLNDDIKMDYFAVSLPDFLVFDENLHLRNQIHCHYMLALGYLGLGQRTDATAHFKAIAELRPDHPGLLRQ